MRADAKLPGTWPGRPIRGMTPGFRQARVGFRIAHLEPRTLHGHHAGEVGAITGHTPLRGTIQASCALAQGGNGSNEKCRAFTLEDAINGFASQKFAGVSVAGIDGGLDRSRNFGVADDAVRNVAAVQLA